jgi:hypothetical protein
MGKPVTYGETVITGITVITVINSNNETAQRIKKGFFLTFYA